MSFMKFTLIVLAIYSVYYGLNIIFDLLKSTSGGNSKSSKNTIQVIQDDKLKQINSEESPQEVNNIVPTVNISFEDIEKEYSEKFPEKNSKDNAIVADLGIEVLESSAGISVFQLENQNLENYDIA